MISIISSDHYYVFSVLGLHKLWCLKSRIDVPKQQLLSVKRLDGDVVPFFSIRLLGTHLPGVITAGTFYSKGEKIFCDVTDKSTALVFELKDGPYSRIIANVDNPEEALSLLGSYTSSDSSSGRS